jgi:tetratricopeptide (TPR) repeat protein
MLAPVVLAAAVASVYLPSMANALIYDDTLVIETQEAPRSLADFARIFAERHFPNLPYYRPVTRLTLLGQKTLHGDEPAPYHAFNALLMGLTALAAYGLLRRPVFQLDRWTALAAAAVCTLHPHASWCVYPVSSGRETLLPSAWTLLAVWAFLHSGTRWYALAVAAAAAALLSKEPSVVLPAVFVCADLLGLAPDAPGRDLRRWLVRYAPLAALWGVYFVVRQKLFGGAEYAFGSLTGPVLAVLYAFQTLVAPFRDLVYEPPTAVWFSPLRLLAAAAAAGGCVWLAVRSRTAFEPATRFWLCWFVLALLPTANLLRQEAPFDERYVFLASLGILAPAARALSATASALGARRAAAAATAVLVLACAAVALHRARFFRDDVAFSRRWLETNPASVNAHFNMAYALARGHDLGGAVEHYREALRIRPDYVLAHNNLGNALSARGETSAAAFELRRALELDPGYADAHHNLGLLLAGEGKLDEAAREFRAALHARPAFAEAHNNLGNALAGQGKMDEAIAEFAEAVRLRPTYAAAHNNLANALALGGKLQEAVEHYSLALRAQPDYPEARRNLDLVLDRLAPTRPK